MKHILLWWLMLCALPAFAEGDIPKQFRERQILVTLAADREAEWDVLTQALLHDYTLQKSGAFPLQSLGIQCLALRVPESQNVEETINRLRSDARVEHVQQNQEFTSQYNDQYASLQHGANALHLENVHKHVTGKGVKIAIIDTGFDIEHPDLKGRFAHTENFVEGGESSFNTDTHGTAVAGVIGARANNKMGVYGVAPEAELLGYKSCWYPAAAGRARCSSWTLVKAIDKAIVDKAQVINLSLAGPEDRLIARLLARADANNIVVVAAIDDSSSDNIGFPAALPTVIAVMAQAEKSSAPKTASLRADTVAAPGAEVLTTFPGGRYDFASGSSLAAAHVSGVAALLLHNRQGLTPDELRAMLHNGVDGKLNVCALLNGC
jgi:subtilisin family serine protease